VILRNKQQRRSGTAAVEFAVCAPFLFMMMMGMLELGRACMVKEILTDAGRKACRTGVYQGQTDAQVVQDCLNILNDNFGTTTANLCTITIQVAAGPSPRGTGVPWTSSTPSVTWVTSTVYSSGAYTTQNDYLSTLVKRGDAILVKVSAPVSKVGWVYGWFLPNADIESEYVVMMRQG
jgi:Flp pilus assembly protein TadG